MRRLALSQRITYVCPSKWIQSEAAKSLDASVRIDHVANGFDLGVYQFRPRDEARRLLGLPADGKIVAICCGSFENKIKGMPFAFDALRANSDLAITALLIGRLDSKIQNSLSQVKCITPGFVTDRVQLGLLLSSADVLLHPSLGDNLPITIQESMAAGTPVLAFDVGGVPELVRDGQTGWLVPVGNQNALNSALRRVLESGETALYGARARDFIANEYSAKICVDRHLELYELAVRSWRAETAEP